MSVHRLSRGVGVDRIGLAPEGAIKRALRSMLAWARGLGRARIFGIEGTSSYGAGLARFLRAHGEQVIEVLELDALTTKALPGLCQSMPLRP